MSSLQRHQNIMPQNPVLRARIRLLNDHCDNIFTKTQFTYLMNKDQDKDDHLVNEMEKALLTYENSLDKSGGPYLLGSQFTLADLHIFPFIQRLIVSLRHWKGYELPKDKFPKLLGWFSSCQARESVKMSSMTDEKIIQVYQKFMDVGYSFGGLNQNKN
jgi:glutathione S-transferase